MTDEEFDQAVTDFVVGVREGLLSKDWERVLQHYNEFADDNLEIPEDDAPKMSRLEKVRSGIKGHSSNIESDDNDHDEKRSRRTDDVTSKDVVIQESGNMKIISVKEDPKLQRENRKFVVAKEPRPPQKTVFDLYKDKDINLNPENSRSLSKNG